MLWTLATVPACLVDKSARKPSLQRLEALEVQSMPRLTPSFLWAPVSSSVKRVRQRKHQKILL